jgi:hypothetical protein
VSYRTCRVTPASALACAAVLLASCSSASTDDAQSTTTRPEATTTTAAPTYRADVVHETEVSPGYRQGVAKIDGGWIFSLNDALFRTDDDFTELQVASPAIPPEYASRGFDHVGDIDVVDGTVYVPLEQPDYTIGTQVMARYRVDTLAFEGGVDVAQHHNSFVTVDADTGIAYSMDMFGGQALLRYDTRDEWRVLPPIAMSMAVDKVQGGDIVGDAIWLSTDDATDGVYRVDVETGAVQSLGSIGHADGEGEGIDATPLPSGELHVLSADVAVVPMRLIDLHVTDSVHG